ncbi:tripartite motif-containing protein 2-like isoform X2 [Anneissia japonica]|uniref:tripartite motif-containing protein 2-like isoform X2 n=1 Tax=Anneissia japonica TaxID=1529436 RepID=UPI001425B557|nr:tripartite motif-containing protein 2-like isoform X2 [Anneissia japonica]
MASGNWHCVSVPALCPTHQSYRQEFYCKTCEEPICQQCIAEKHKLPKHKRENIDQTTKKYQEKLNSILPMKTKLIDDLETSVSSIGNTLLRLESARVNCADDVDKQYKKAELLLKNKRQELLDDLEEKFKNKRTVLTEQRSELLEARSEAVSAIHFVQRVKWYDDHKTAFGAASNRYKEMKEALAKELQLQPQENWRIYFDENKKLDEIINATILGAIETTSSVAFTSCLTNTDFQDTRIGSSKLLKLVAKNSRGEAVKEGGADVEVELIYQNMETQNLEINDNDDGTYSIQMRPNKIGEARLVVKMFGNPIKDCPYKFTVKPANHLLLKFTHEVFKEKGPFGVTVSRKGEIFIVNRTQTVYIFDRDGKLKRSLIINGAKYLQGITVNNDGTFIVTDNQMREIFKCDKNGQILQRFGANVLEDPIGVTVGSDKCVYVVDYKGHCVQKFQNQGEYVKRFIHSKPGEAISPWFISTSIDSRFVISDTWAHYIHVFDSNGTALFKFGTYGKRFGQLEYPKGVAVDKDNCILVSSEHRLQLFSSTGVYKWRIDNERDGLRDPRGIAIIPEVTKYGRS